MLRRPSPGETYRYISEVDGKFRTYVENDILPRLGSDDITTAQTLTGLQYLLVNHITEHDARVLEVLTGHHSGPEAVELYKAALGVVEDHRIPLPRLARVLATSMLSRPHAARDRMFEQRLKSLGRPASLVLLEQIRPGLTRKARRQLVQLVRSASGTRSPRKLSDWVAATGDELEEMKAEWESLIDPHGTVRTALDSPDPDETTEPRPGSSQAPPAPGQ